MCKNKLILYRLQIPLFQASIQIGMFYKIYKINTKYTPLKIKVQINPADKM